MLVFSRLLSKNVTRASGMNFRAIFLRDLELRGKIATKGKSFFSDASENNGCRLAAFLPLSSNSRHYSHTRELNFEH
jgi:hypothetical protein